MAVNCICDKNLCTGCAACSQLCPKSAISMQENEEGFLYPSISDACIECGLCIKKCPVNAEVEKYPTTFYMGWHKDKEVLLNSSSGGIFTAIAKYVFDRQGVVFGAAKNLENNIVHTFAENTDELNPLKKSKYYQSQIGESYREAKAFLDKNRLVLFAGTACQIAGLRIFLGKEYKNLITIDVLCHGVASKKIVDAFLKSKEKQFHKVIRDYHFRVKDKERGWFRGNGTRMHLLFEDGSSVIEPGKYDTFFLGFNNNFFLRESCYRCKFCGTDRVSDFTLADYWGCNNPEISEEQKKLGVSLILPNTDKARDILGELSEDLIYYQIDGTNAIARNRALVRPQDRPAIRDVFYKKMERKGYDPLIHSQFRKKFFKRKIKSVLRVVMPKRFYYKRFKD